MRFTNCIRVLISLPCVWVAASAVLRDDTKPPSPNSKSVAEWVQQLKDPKPEARVQAAQMLALLGPKAKEAAPALVAEMRSEPSHALPDPKMEAAKALWKVDSARYLEELKGKNREEKWTAVFALIYIGPEAKDAIPTLVEMIKNHRDNNRPHALLALGHLDPDANLALPLLVDALHDRLGQYARMMAAQGLEAMGVKAQPAAQDLREALDDEDILVRVHAAGALWVVDKQTASVLPVLKAALKDRERGAGQQAVYTLGRMGADAKPAFTALLEAYQGETNKFLQSEMATTLKRIDPEAAAKSGIK